MVGLSQAPSARWLALALDAGQGSISRVDFIRHFHSPTIRRRWPEAAIGNPIH